MRFGIAGVRRLGRRGQPASQRALAVGCHQTVMRTVGVALGLHRRLQRLAPRGRQTVLQAGLQAGAPARKHARDGAKSGGDTTPLLVVATRQQLDAVTQPGDHTQRGT